ncbi:MAG TPA: FAD binding domain-containing protein [Actinomycetota bacterium]|nr:FAD binding domain-containing protein [Actinomycetota bacterium]
MVDINRIPGLDVVEESNGHLRIGTLARHNQLAADSLIGQHYPTIASAAPQIADPLVRNLGTIGGSLAHADPAGDWGSVMLALNAEVVARGPTGERKIPIDDFLVDIFTTSLNEDEIVTDVLVPKPEGSFGGAYLKLERKVGDFATVGVAVHLELDGDMITRAGVGLTAVGSRNIKATNAENTLVGSECTDDLFAEAARLAAESADPVSDVRGPAEYKRAVVGTYVNRGLAEARDQARAGSGRT